MALLRFPRRSRGSSETLNDDSLTTIGRILSKSVEMGQIGQPWQLTVVENLLDRMLVRLRKLHQTNRARR